MNTTATIEIDSDAVLTAFLEDLETGVPVRVADWSARFPALGRDFARVAASHFAGETPDMTENAATESRLLFALRRQKAAYFAAAITSLVDKERGITAAKLASALDLPLSFVAKLNQRLFQVATIPAALVNRLADTVGRGADEIAAYLSQPPRLAHGAAYRADDAPTVGQAEDFAAALAKDAGVSDAARALYMGSGES